MARSSAATVARPPAKRRKSSHTSTQTHRRPARRTSGPAKGRTTAQKRPVAAAGARTASAAAPTVRPKPRTAPRRPAPQARRESAVAPLVHGLVHGRAGALIDRLLRGRACVAIVFALLVGIVFSNVSLLELNKGIAATNAEATAIEQENAKLRRQIAPLASSERIQREAVKHGYSLPAAGDVRYIGGDLRKNAKKAAARMTAPGMGEGTASRPAAQVEQAEQAERAAQTGQTAPAPPTANCQLPANCQPPTAHSPAPPTTPTP